MMHVQVLTKYLNIVPQRGHSSKDAACVDIN